ncbi:MAG: rod-binding protein [Burkholderiaceae bacterium]|jgi:peptidoglycan hydrolase FlgJ|nr:rod-binding protein [Burkholderiaceae bacterium]
MSESTQINSAAKSYNDFTALGELRGKAQRNEAGAMRESAEQFEALFIQMMLKSMREASSAMKSDLLHNDAQETFEGMYDKEISMQMAKRNALGFTDVVIKNLSQQKSVPSTSELLQLRQTSTIQNGMPLNAPVLPMSLVNKAQAGMALQKNTLKPLPLAPAMPMKLGNEP